MDPITTGQLVTLGASFLGAPRSSSAGPTRADSSAYGAYDGSNWTVNFGSGGGTGLALQSGGTAGIPAWLLIVGLAAGVLLWKNSNTRPRRLVR